MPPKSKQPAGEPIGGKAQMLEPLSLRGGGGGPTTKERIQGSNKRKAADGDEERRLPDAGEGGGKGGGPTSLDAVKRDFQGRIQELEKLVDAGGKHETEKFLGAMMEGIDQRSHKHLEIVKISLDQCKGVEGQVDAGHKQAVRDIKSTVAQQSKRGAEEEEEILGMIKNALESTNAEVKKLTRKFLSTA